MSATLGVGSGGSTSYSSSYYGEFDQYEFPSVIPPTLFPYQSSVGGHQPTNPSAGGGEEDESLISLPEASLVLSSAGFLQALRQHDEILAARRRWNNRPNGMGWNTNNDGMEMMELCQSPDISVVRMEDCYSTSISPMSSPASSFHKGRCNTMPSGRLILDAPIPASILTYELRNQRLGVGSSNNSSNSGKTEAEDATKTEKNGYNDPVPTGRSLLSQILGENENPGSKNTNNHQQEDPGSSTTINSLGEVDQELISGDDYNLQTQLLDQQQEQDDCHWSQHQYYHLHLHHHHHHSRERNMALTSQDFDVRVLLPLLQLEEEELLKLKQQPYGSDDDVAGSHKYD